MIKPWASAALAIPAGAFTSFIEALKGNGDGYSTATIFARFRD